jgi:hypothetical protein
MSKKGYALILESLTCQFAVTLNQTSSDGFSTESNGDHGPMHMYTGEMPQFGGLQIYQLDQSQNFHQPGKTKEIVNISC